MSKRACLACIFNLWYELFDKANFIGSYRPPLNMIGSIRSKAGFGFKSRNKPLFLTVGEMLDPQHAGNIQVEIAADLLADAFGTTRQTGLAAGLIDDDNPGP